MRGRWSVVVSLELGVEGVVGNRRASRSFLLSVRSGCDSNTMWFPVVFGVVLELPCCFRLFLLLLLVLSMTLIVRLLCLLGGGTSARQFHDMKESGNELRVGNTEA